MAYSRKPRRRPKRRQQRRKRSTFKRRSTRKRSRGMTRKHVLNITSVKKHDNMLSWVPTSETNPAGGGSATDIVLPADSNTRIFMYSPTARIRWPPSTSTLLPAVDLDPVSTRTSTSVFARGYRETTTFRLSGPTPYRMRRVVFVVRVCPTLLLQRILPSHLTSFVILFRLSAMFGNLRISLLLLVSVL